MNEDPLPAWPEPSVSTTLDSADGLSLFCRAWYPADPPQGGIAIVHGLGEHSGRYHHLAAYFHSRGYALFTFDLRGHGRSAGKRGHVEQFDDYLADLQRLIDYAHDQTPEIPLFLLGHSLGGLIALNYAIQHGDQISAVIAAGPTLRLRIKTPAWKAALSNLTSTFNPGRSMSSGFPLRFLSRNKSVLKAYRTDPLVHNKVTARWLTEFAAAAAWTIDEAHAMAVPTLILQGGSDRIVDPAGAREFFDRIGLEDKYYIEYEALYHELFNEPEVLSVLGDVEAWLMPRLQDHFGAMLNPIAASSS